MGAPVVEVPTVMPLSREGKDAQGWVQVGRTTFAVGRCTCVVVYTGDAENEKSRQWRQKDTTSAEQKRTEGKGQQESGTGGSITLPCSLDLEGNPALMLVQ